MLERVSRGLRLSLTSEILLRTSLTFLSARCRRKAALARRDCTLFLPCSMGEAGNIGIIWGNIGYIERMEKKMETTILYWKKKIYIYKGPYWGHIGIMEKKMETTILYQPQREESKVFSYISSTPCRNTLFASL